MKIKFNNGFKIYPNKNQLQYLELKKQKEASENISNCIAKIKHQEFFTQMKGGRV